MSEGDHPDHTTYYAVGLVSSSAHAVTTTTKSYAAPQLSAVCWTCYSMMQILYINQP